MTATVVKGAGLNAAARFGTQILAIAGTAVVARLVPPRAYGLMGMAAVVIGFAALFRDIGTASAIVQRRDIDDGLLTSVFWLNLFDGDRCSRRLLADGPLGCALLSGTRAIGDIAGSQRCLFDPVASQRPRRFAHSPAPIWANRRDGTCGRGRRLGGGHHGRSDGRRRLEPGDEPAGELRCLRRRHDLGKALAAQAPLLLG